jgi:hypothetical protein
MKEYGAIGPWIFIYVYYFLMHYINIVKLKYRDTKHVGKSRNSMFCVAEMKLNKIWFKNLRFCFANCNFVLQILIHYSKKNQRRVHDS